MPLAIHTRRLLVLLTSLGMVALLSGCGFQPRGQAGGLSGVPSPLYVSGIGRYSPLHRALERQLAQSGGHLAPDAGGSAAELHISRHRSEARVLSVDSRNKAVENELEESARFELRSGASVVTEPQTVRVVRIQFRPSDAILAADREAEQIRDDMRRELAQRILQRVAAQH